MGGTLTAVVTQYKVQSLPHVQLRTAFSKCVLQHCTCTFKFTEVQRAAAEESAVAQLPDVAATARTEDGDASILASPAAVCRMLSLCCSSARMEAIVVDCRAAPHHEDMIITVHSIIASPSDLHQCEV